MIPIIENTARESELTGRLRLAMEQYPETQAVLVRRHGVYVWGKTWIQAKTQAECYDYLFEAAFKLRQLGIDCSRAPGPSPVPGSLQNGHATPGKGYGKSFLASMRSILDLAKLILKSMPACLGLWVDHEGIARASLIGYGS